jgi:hypothetical protein
MRRDRKDLHRTEATARAAAYEKLTVPQKIKKLDELLGKGIGAKRQRARLEASAP